MTNLPPVQELSEARLPDAQLRFLLVACEDDIANYVADFDEHPHADPVGEFNPYVVKALVTELQHSRAAEAVPTGFTWTDDMYAAFNAIQAQKSHPHIEQLQAVWRALHAAAEFNDGNGDRAAQDEGRTQDQAGGATSPQAGGEGAVERRTTTAAEQEGVAASPASPSATGVRVMVPEGGLVSTVPTEVYLAYEDRAKEIAARAVTETPTAVKNAILRFVLEARLSALVEQP